jgi:hypothetical protein
MVSTMSAALLGGGLPDTINSSGNTVISRGLGIGPYLFIVAPAIKISAGLVLRQIKVPETEKIKTVENQKKSGFFVSKSLWECCFR